MKLKHSWLPIAVLAASWCGSAAFAQPVNDTCAGAIELFCSDVVSGTTVGAAADVMPICNMVIDGTGGGVWYKIFGTGDQISMNTCSAGTSFNTRVRVYTGGCATPVCVTGNDTVSSSVCVSIAQARAQWLSVPGVEYLVLVHGAAAQQGTFDLTVTCIPPQPEDCTDAIDNDFDGLIDCNDADCGAAANCLAGGNDFCSGAIPLSCGSVITGTTVGATPDPWQQCGPVLSSQSPGRWFSFIGTGDYVRMSTCSASTGFDTRLRVWSGSCSAPVCVTGNDEANPACSFNVNFAQAEWFSVPGVEYRILLNGFSNQSGPFELTVTCSLPDPENCFDGIDNDFDGTIDCNDVDCITVPACTPPSNDECAAAIPVSVGTTLISNVNGTPGALPLPAGPCNVFGAIDSDVWYVFTPSATGVYELNTCDAASWDTDVVVYSGPCGALAQVACNGNAIFGLGGCQVGYSRLQTSLTSGVAYSIRVGSRIAGVEGSGNLNIISMGPEDCDDGIDNDNDGVTDCADSDCCGAPGCLPVPANDDCANAPLVGLGVAVASGTLNCASSDSTANCGGSGGNPDVWYRFTAPWAGDFSFSTCGSNDAPGVDLGPDTTLAIFDGCGGAQLGCVDDDPGACNGSDLGLAGDATVTVALNLNETAWIRVSHFSSWIGTGAFTLGIEAFCGTLEPFTCSFDCPSETAILTWSNTPFATSGFDIYENGVLLASVPAGTTSYAHVGAPVGTNEYEIAWACSIGGSGPSATCQLTNTTIPPGTQELIIDNEDPDLVASGAALEQSLIANGRSVVRMRVPNFDAQYANGCLDLQGVESIWCTLGTFPEEYRLTFSEGNLLASLNRDLGIGVYLESGDHWGFAHLVTSFDDRDGVDAAGNTNGNDTFDAMLAQDPGFGPDLVALFPGAQVYTQASASNDLTDQLVVAAADLEVAAAGAIWVNSGAGEPAYITGIHAENIAGAPTVVQSWEFGGFPAVGRDALAQAYLQMLGRVVVGCPSPGPSQFVRGDCNRDGSFNIADPITALSHLFPQPGGAPIIACMDALDGNDDGLVNIADPITLLGVLFPAGGPAPTIPPPNSCDCDPTPDTLDCADFAPICL